ncbi:RNA polymerase sigma factor [Cohnella soli]|uniref:RNA polymerase sigma factor n=1 Tax=Cohnella soli TaxID=425005 RepID=A0ABW0HUC3_9BACL
MSGAFIHAGNGDDRLDAASAYEAWVSPHLLDLKKYCYYLAGSRWDAEDLLQDTLLKSLVYIVQAEPRANMKPFIFRIARNLWIDDYRRRKNKRSMALDVPETTHTDSNYAEIRGSLEWLAERFPRRSIEMWLLFNYFGYSMQEVAEALGVTVSSVKSSLFRTRDMLRRKPELKACRSPLPPEVERWSTAVLLDHPHSIYVSQP